MKIFTVTSISDNRETNRYVKWKNIYLQHFKIWHSDIVCLELYPLLIEQEDNLAETQTSHYAVYYTIYLLLAKYI